MILWCHGFAIKKCRYNGSQWGKNSHEQQMREKKLKSNAAQKLTMHQSQSCY